MRYNITLKNSYKTEIECEPGYMFNLINKVLSDKAGNGGLNVYETWDCFYVGGRKGRISILRSEITSVSTIEEQQEKLSEIDAQKDAKFIDAIGKK